MALPVEPLATDHVPVAGGTVDIRSLSRSEVIALAGYADDPGGAEAYIISCATGGTIEEAQAWRQAVNAKTAAVLLNAIAVLSGIRRGDDPNP